MIKIAKPSMKYPEVSAFLKAARGRRIDPDTGKSISTTAIGLLCGASQTTVSSWENGASRPSGDLAAVADAYNVLEDDLAEVLARAGQHNVRKRGVDHKYADEPNVTAVVPSPGPIGTMPMYFGAAGGKCGAIIMSDFEPARISRPRSLLGVKGAYGVRVDGDSMDPKHRHGSIAHVNPDYPYSQGDSVVIQVLEEGPHWVGYIKEFVSVVGDVLTVKQYNPAENLVFESGVQAIHRVVGTSEI